MPHACLIELAQTVRVALIGLEWMLGTFNVTQTTGIYLHTTLSREFVKMLEKIECPSEEVTCTHFLNIGPFGPKLHSGFLNWSFTQWHRGRRVTVDLGHWCGGREGGREAHKIHSWKLTSLGLQWSKLTPNQKALPSAHQLPSALLSHTTCCH